MARETTHDHLPRDLLTLRECSRRLDVRVLRLRHWIYKDKVLKTYRERDNAERVLISERQVEHLMRRDERKRLLIKAGRYHPLRRTTMTLDAALATQLRYLRKKIERRLGLKGTTLLDTVRMVVTKALLEEERHAAKSRE